MSSYRCLTINSSSDPSTPASISLFFSLSGGEFSTPSGAFRYVPLDCRLVFRGGVGNFLLQGLGSETSFIEFSFVINLLLSTTEMRSVALLNTTHQPQPQTTDPKHKPQTHPA